MIFENPRSYECVQLRGIACEVGKAYLAIFQALKTHKI